MADPVTLAIIGTTAAVAGAGVSAAGAYSAGQAQSNMYKYQAGVAGMNKTVADQNRDYAFQSGEVEAQDQGMKSRFQIGQTKAIQGAGNLDVNTGTNSDIRDSEAAIGSQNQTMARSNAAKKAYGFEVDAANDTAQGQVYQMAADNAIMAANYKVAGSIIGGASAVAGKWTQASSAFGSGAAQPFYSASQDAIY